MEPFKSGLVPPRFCLESQSDGRGGVSSAGALDIYIHHARNIHNICIYANQDVYAKFSLTCNPDDAVSTRIIDGGGKNPQFNERLQLQLKLPNPAAAVLKCEIWMLSRARNFLEDQLLGFALVPLSDVAESGGGRLTRDFSLSSTDLFHSPAGTVQLTLSFDEKSCLESSISNSSSISSEFVILDPARIEFPEVNVDKENLQMVSEYFSVGASPVPFVHLGGSSESIEDCEMTVNSNESPDENSFQNSGLFSTSTITSISDDRQVLNTVSCSASKGPSPDTPTSKSGKGSTKGSAKEEEDGVGGDGEDGELGSVFKYPLGNINIEAQQSAIKQQIVDMYMKSMQQFTESLAKMKLPMDLDNPKPEEDEDVIQSQKGNKKLDSNKKDGSRVFYGSRAFF
ncbi:uncharacterized protein LOC110028312 [Phalaenopsis equestris]|uniref:uncharacterized protein LOC110028312 n=1 Tax=Phalaenopsis equestris TaxID=78828 RepID=UPI0009E42818|nr:uncharacterized protein LOC110028312 [Phalaenopsis equestris]